MAANEIVAVVNALQKKENRVVLNGGAPGPLSFFLDEQEIEEGPLRS